MVHPLRILPSISNLVDKNVHIFIDCSITRGTDAFNSLASRGEKRIKKVIAEQAKNCDAI